MSGPEFAREQRIGRDAIQASKDPFRRKPWKLGAVPSASDEIEVCRVGTFLMVTSLENKHLDARGLFDLHVPADNPVAIPIGLRQPVHVEYESFKIVYRAGRKIEGNDTLQVVSGIGGTIAAPEVVAAQSGGAGTNTPETGKQAVSNAAVEIVPERVGRKLLTVAVAQVAGRVYALGFNNSVTIANGLNIDGTALNNVGPFQWQNYEGALWAILDAAGAGSISYHEFY